MPTSALTEGQFITGVLDQFDGGLLLDVNNIIVNSVNFGRPPLDLLRELPIHRTKHIHLAGHKLVDDLAIDDHGSAVPANVWQLYREVIEMIGPVPTMIEWETNTPTWDLLLDEADKARKIQDDYIARKAAGQIAARVTP
jgi:uncharacterized protein (UPF0276 family)